MKSFIDQFKEALYNRSTEGKKLRRPDYATLLEYKDLPYKLNSYKVLGFGAGRSGQNWLSKIFNTHPNWVGTNERFYDYEAFYRYITYHQLPIDRTPILKLLELSVKHDQYKYGNSFITSPYFSFGMEELFSSLHPTDIFLNIRKPVSSIESFYAKGFYATQEYFLSLEKNQPSIDIQTGVYRGMSRIIPSDDFKQEWLSLTRIGKITWFWAVSNQQLYSSFKNLPTHKKYLLKLEEIHNYDFYQFLDSKFDFENKLIKKEFYKVIEKTPNKIKYKNYKYKNWTQQEKKEYEYIVETFFPDYTKISQENVTK